MERKYLITLKGPSESECSQVIRTLDQDQYNLVSGIIGELWCDSNASLLQIHEIPIRVIDKVRVLSRGNILVCSDAECLSTYQFVKADFSDTVFQVSALEYLPHVPSVGVILRPNDQASDIPLGASLEVLS